MTKWLNNEENVATGQKYNDRNSIICERTDIQNGIVTQSLVKNMTNRIKTVTNVAAVNTETNFTNFGTNSTSSGFKLKEEFNQRFKALNKKLLRLRIES